MYILLTEPNLEPHPYNVPVCPVCGFECDLYYTDINGDVVACDGCMDAKKEYETVVNAWEAME